MLIWNLGPLYVQIDLKEESAQQSSERGNGQIKSDFLARTRRFSSSAFREIHITRIWYGNISCKMKYRPSRIFGAVICLSVCASFLLAFNSLSSYYNWVLTEKLLCRASEMVKAVGNTPKTVPIFSYA